MRENLALVSLLLVAIQDGYFLRYFLRSLSLFLSLSLSLSLSISLSTQQKLN